MSTSASRGVGGGFGGKASGVPLEHVVVAAAAVDTGRPVRYVEDRAANLVGMQGRGVHQEAELHARPDGTVTSLRLDIVCDSGAYPGIAAIEPVKMRLMASGPYRIPSRVRPGPRRLHQPHTAGVPTAARAAPRPPPCWSGPWTCSPAGSASTRSRCGAATSCNPRTSRTPRRPA